ncbi:hypothetical protein KUH03_04780 [Sphingobacterium sp. E70]|uniref:aminopeptidase P N-terminal domain-containing protein n=1 Tax=Sphingobacterium sp. E70 TaxID=2853439 RepID=UPI00211CCB07|nr:aminopeptidase P N-terminal domain-containing protein [Sphingobacterium sp. E70]ULT26240.1 hypothetical protein KUH03_04780 [Sphingobacterium sp. E70]
MGETLLFGDEMTIDDIIWMGQQQTLTEKAALSGISKLLPFDQLFDYLKKAIKIHSITFLPINRTIKYCLGNCLIAPLICFNHL